HFRVMAFAQLTYRESLRDIEACLSAQASKLYHMGFREPIRRSTLSDADEARDWRIYADFAQVLIRQARKLYALESFGVELSETVYALDSTTIDLCLSVFPWAPFRATKAAVPARLVERANGCCRQCKLVAQEDQCPGAFGVPQTDATQLIGIMLLAVVAVESDGLVADDPGGAIGRRRVEATGVEIRFGAGHEEGAGLM